MIIISQTALEPPTKWLTSEKDQEEFGWMVLTVLEMKSHWKVAHTMDGELMIAAILKMLELLVVSIL